MPQTILHLAVQGGSVQIVKDALNTPGIDINVKNDDGDTALHLAIKRRDRDIMSLLLTQEKTDYKIRNNQHQTPKKLAKELGDWDMVEIIEQNIRQREQKIIDKSVNSVQLGVYYYIYNHGYEAYLGADAGPGHHYIQPNTGPGSPGPESGNPHCRFRIIPGR